MSDFVLTDFFCPHCTRRIELQIGLAEQRVLTAIALQAGQLGTEIDCPHCGVGFVYTRLGQHRTGRPDPQYPAQPGSSPVSASPPAMPSGRRTCRTHPHPPAHHFDNLRT